MPQERPALNPSRLAAALFDQRRAREQFRPFPAEAGVSSLADAYRVQECLVERLRERSGASPAGYKIGLTSASMQEMCGINQPIAGVVLSDCVHRSGVVLSVGRYGRLGLEFEIGVRIGRTLDGSSADITLEDVANAVDAICPAIEVVDDRRADYGALDIHTLVADNSWNAGAVLGNFVTNLPDPKGICGIVRRNNVEEARGVGADVLGHPFEAIRWLAAHLAAEGRALLEGEIVLTGSIARTIFPTEPAAFELELVGIGSVSATVTT